MAMGVPEPRYEGTVKSYNPEKGWGHIECPEVTQQYGKDVFLLKSQLIGVATVMKGQSVRFGLADNGRGPEATQIEILNGSTGLASMIPTGLPMATPQTMIPQPAPVATGSYVGNIKSFNPNSGWGHISCAQTEQIYGKDVFFMKSQVPGGMINKGTMVQFSVVQGVKGPEGHNIRPVGGAPAVQGFGGMVGMQPAQNRSQPQMRNTGVVGQPQNFAGNNNAVCNMPSTSVFFGTLKSFNEEKGWGHISCPQTQAVYGKDMFVLRSALNGAPVSVGDSVGFQVSMGQKGPEAHNVKVIPGSSEQILFSGSIKLWNEDKGYGFIACDDTKNIYQKDIFIHKKDLNGHRPTPGETVQFSVVISEQGRPEATGIMFTSGMMDGGMYGAVRNPAAPRPGPF